MSIIKVATCQLDQWALDFDANLERVKKSIREAKAQVTNFHIRFNPFMLYVTRRGNKVRTRRSTCIFTLLLNIRLLF
jgi:hypothetical protein